jgi:hypothetical protein
MAVVFVTVVVFASAEIENRFGLRSRVAVIVETEPLQP